VKEHFDKIIEAQANLDACARIIDAGCKFHPPQDGYTCLRLLDQRETGNEIRGLGDTLQNHSTKLDAIIEKLNLTFTTDVYLRLGTILQQLEQSDIRSAAASKHDYDSDEAATEGDVLHRESTFSRC
jgi:hypothetical protein